MWKGFERSWRGLEKRLVQPEKEMTERAVEPTKIDNTADDTEVANAAPRQR